MWRNNPSPSSSANAAASPPPPPSQPLDSGVLGKRKANDSTQQHDSERFAKRFNLLSLEANAQQHSNSNYYLPVSTNTNNHTPSEDVSEPMSLDDSRDRVYISDLDSEFASIAASEAALEASQKLIFLPDIERHFNQMPREMLRLQNNPSGSRIPSILHNERAQEQAQELVLYTLPRTLTNEDEGASETRKAILEARQRAREKALGEAREREMNAMYSSSSGNTLGGSGSGIGGGGGNGRAREEVETETAHGYGVEGYEEWRDVEEDDRDEDEDDVMDMD